MGGKEPKQGARYLFLFVGSTSVEDIVYQPAEAVRPEIVKEELIYAHVQILKDNEAEVRTAGVSKLPRTLPL